MNVIQVNLWEGFGGSEVYTRFLSIALQRLGIQPKVALNARAAHWNDFRFGDAEVVRLRSANEIEGLLPDGPAVILANSPLPPEVGRRVRERHQLVTWAHQPVYLKDLTPYKLAHLMPCVSEHVMASARAARLPVYPHPMYGIADFDRRRTHESTIVARAPYQWDRRKLRDRVLGAVEPLVSPVRKERPFKRAGRITLGIVSRIAGIKQFPEMFRILAPVLARHPEVRLEIFGAGGYGAVRDLRQALEPARDQVRFWGEHEDIRAVFGCMDFLLAGLPEREGMGRNVLEAQAFDVPVLAVDAPPFTETVLDGGTGFLFTDPRVDGGAHFDRILGALEATEEAWPRPSDHPEHLSRFTLDTFTQMVAGLLEYIDVELDPPCTAFGPASAPFESAA